MGGLLSTRQREGLEENDPGTTHAYRYPPKSGNYFGTHFIMGGERFDTPQPESYLFGENTDLNFLGSHPTPFPYPPPSPNEPTKTLRCLVNIRKESLRFVRAASVEFSKIDKTSSRDIELGTNTCFNIEFMFDSDVRCAITIHYFCVEEVTPNGVTYTPRDPLLSSETFHYKKGSSQQFCQPQHVFNPAKYPEDELLFDFDKEIIPIVIQCVAEEGPEEIKQSHTTIATVEKITDGTYLLKGLKQKLFVDGLCYLLQEIYGIENKHGDKVGLDDETEDNGSECVICMCDVRDTLILPCRHLCLCNSCADSLRYQANNCPICRAPFRALLQIRALQKCSNPSLAPLSPPDGVCDNIPPGYEAVSLIEALNGPCLPRQPPSAMPDLVETPESDHVIAAHLLNRLSDSPPSKRGSNPDSPVYSKTMLMTPRIESIDSKEPQKCPLLKDGKEVLIKGRYRSKDSVKLVNEIEKEEILDEDSDGEKLSPLLQKRDRSNNLALHMAEVITHIDNDQDIEEIREISEQPVAKSGKYERGDESDYYTPDEPAPQVMYDSNAASSSVESTPQRLPGTPMSQASVKSSGDSYTSGSSTKHLLAVVGTSSSDPGKDI